jgi:hypothetical protein
MGLEQREQLATQLRQNALLLTLTANFITEQRFYLDYPNLDAQNWWDSFASGRGYFLSICIPFVPKYGYKVSTLRAQVKANRSKSQCLIVETIVKSITYFTESLLA